MINDEELINIFIEEAKDLLENITRSMKQWHVVPTDKNMVTSILRDLHTLKGGARMVGFIDLNSYTHSLEKILQCFSQKDTIASEKALKAIQYSLDYIHFFIDEYVKKKKQIEKNELQKGIQALSSALSMAPEEEIQRTVSKGNAPPLDNATEAEKKTTEYIRIDEKLVEKIRKTTVQVNVSRAQLEQKIKQSIELISESEKQLKLMKEQLHHVQVKTDANIRIQQATLSEKYDDFDVLEMDRYTYVQQSTRFLDEKLNQLEIINNTVLGTMKNAESTLVQQKRIGRELESQINHTQLISFSNVIPRLERIVRQVSHELNKEVCLVSSEVVGEIDRKVLDALISPLEHIVRNAIDHGIETPEIRKQLGKPACGQLNLSFVTRGNEAILQLSDDGQGIDVEKVMAKSVEKKQWLSQRSMTPMEAIHMILLPGFSTKNEASYISGHGVGLDVANVEVRKLGGVLYVYFEKNKGTTITMRIPFNTALSQALVFFCANQLFALSLSKIIGIITLSQFDLRNVEEKQDGKIIFSGLPYTVFYLADLLGLDSEKKEKKVKTLPVLFLNGTECNVALVVDKLLGSREMVIKSLGFQLQLLRDISGVSLLADGKIALLLDDQILMMRIKKHTQNGILSVKEKKEALETSTHSLAQIYRRESKGKVLVVDDSITVRLVTSRLLQRFCYEPVCAQDGEEAFIVMEEHLPDVVLLDLEMPKMDGYSVLEKMRTFPKYKDIPVIIITSRASKKHRERAMQLGANAYLTKPFRDNELMNLLRTYGKKQ